MTQSSFMSGSRIGKQLCALLFLSLVLVVATACGASQGTIVSEGGKDEFVDLSALIPSLVLDVRYATPNNFAQQAVYPSARCVLRRTVAQALVRVQAALRPRGLQLVIWDCYRPISVQQRFWELVPDERYVAKPTFEGGVPVGGSKHNRGAAVDLTLAELDGTLLDMPTDYDDFSERAHRGAGSDVGVTDTQRSNAYLLEQVMVSEGFHPLPTEWWHFDGPGWESYSLADVPFDSIPTTR